MEKKKLKTDRSNTLLSMEKKKLKTDRSNTLLKCPSCQQMATFKVKQVTTHLLIFDENGASSMGGELGQLEDDQTCTCGQCGHTSTIAEFKYGNW